MNRDEHNTVRSFVCRTGEADTHDVQLAILKGKNGVLKREKGIIEGWHCWLSFQNLPVLVY